MTRPALRGRRGRAARRVAFAAAGLLGSAVARAQDARAPADTAAHVTVGAFVDAYYAYDLNRPRALDRAFTTTAARHDEFNVNLAFVEAVLAAPRVRGRLAVQFGTSVQANSAGEPRVGAVSGPDVSRFVQEATAGYRVARAVWVDAGVMLAPFGAESWVSRDDPTYTRSLVADLSPFYEAGVRVAWQATPRLALQGHVMNGWQNVSETNGDKALAVRADYVASPRLTLAYDAFAGNEQPDSVAARARVYQEGIVKLQPTTRLQVTGVFDYGAERRAGRGSASWRGASLVARYQTTARTALALRGEAYDDPERVVAQAAGGALRAAGGSVTADVALTPRLLWRAELRALRNRTPSFPTRGSGAPFGRHDTGVVTSVALTL